MVATFLSGAVLSFDQPARSAFLPSLVPDSDLPSAISLQSTVFTSAAVVAPVVAGLSIARFGFAGNYYLNAVSYLVVICALLTLRLPSNKSRSPQSQVPLRQSIHEGVQALRRDPVLMRAVSGYALLLFVAPSMRILLPVSVDRVLHQGAILLGLLRGAFGIGAIGGALLVRWLSGVLGVETIYLACLSICAAALAVVSSTREIAIYFIVILLLGISQNAISTVTITLMQSRVGKEMRGRVMSLQTLLLVGVRPLGDFPLSLLLAAIGASLTAGIFAAIIGNYGFFLAGTRIRNSTVTYQAGAAKLG